MKMKAFFSKKLFWIYGLMAFLWFILRTGTNPKRLAYPCQQAAFPIASAFVVAFLSLFSGALLIRYFKQAYRILFLIFIAAIFNISSVSSVKSIKIVGSLPAWQVNSPVSKIYALDTVFKTAGSLAAADNTVPDANFDDPSMDSLFNICSSNGLSLYKDATHPDGIVGKEDVVIIKPNFQWDIRLGTNTDRIKGLMNLIFKHPDGFKGEILICENTQDLNDISENTCNSDDTLQSIIDVVSAFQAKGFPVYLYKWRNIRDVKTYEYSTGNYSDGYIIQKDKVTYPKFKSPSGKYYISLRYGVWDSIASSYNKDKLTIINFPVLKAHCMAGATIGIKNWVGVLTTAFTDSLYGGWDPMHYDYFWGNYSLIARVMAVTAPKLTIVDASYTATKTNWEQPPVDNTVVKTSKLIVSTDPLAASWYAAKFVLTPIADFPDLTNPDLLNMSDSTHSYGCILHKWASFLIDSAKMKYTLDSTKISVFKSLSNNNTYIRPSGFSDKDKALIVFPNPSNGQFAIKMPNTSGVAYMSIYSDNGQLVYATKFESHDKQYMFNLSLQKGKYLLSLNLKGKNYSSTLIVK